jgi:hypothetical protein
MKEPQIVAYDDLHYKEDNKKIVAEGTVTLGWMGKWVELDLTEDHIKELGSFLSRWIKVGSKPEIEVKPPSRNNYFKGMRDFAEATPGLSYQKTKAGYAYPKKLRDAYRNYLQAGEQIW